jgi:hypothetical protein
MPNLGQRLITPTLFGFAKVFTGKTIGNQALT